MKSSASRYILPEARERVVELVANAVRHGLVHPTALDGGGMLSDRVRAFKHAGDYESAVAMVCAETGMGRDEAARFVEALR